MFAYVFLRNMKIAELWEIYSLVLQSDFIEQRGKLYGGVTE